MRGQSYPFKFPPSGGVRLVERKGREGFSPPCIFAKPLPAPPRGGNRTGPGFYLLLQRRPLHHAPILDAFIYIVLYFRFFELPVGGYQQFAV